ncbi:hypothetical protein HAX54_052883, partial [Datura stramonium]|nr:hypothetical protein [Datura stramonium]
KYGGKKYKIASVKIKVKKVKIWARDSEPTRWPRVTEADLRVTLREKLRPISGMLEFPVSLRVTKLTLRVGLRDTLRPILRRISSGSR